MENKTSDCAHEWLENATGTKEIKLRISSGESSEAFKVEWDEETIGLLAPAIASDDRLVELAVLALGFRCATDSYYRVELDEMLEKATSAAEEVWDVKKDSLMPGFIVATSQKKYKS